ncbi:MAG: hypothetical protein FLDDKLPJ_00395 [Phycisphaerae bacterium]|nr:hypothetical protein [Phycisphaerae bacterium]
MEPTKELIEAHYRDKVIAARLMTAEEKLLAGPRLFDLECEKLRAGIRSEIPLADEVEIERELHRRLAIMKITEYRRYAR